MKIILDFDHTLFDTPRLKRAVESVFLKHGVSHDLFLRTLEQSKGEGRDWKPERQFAILKSRGVPHVDSIKDDFVQVLHGSHVFLYEDTLPFLEKISKDNSLALLTYGEDSFQNMKLEGCGRATKYFKKIVITQNIYKDKEANDLSGGAKSLFVDDNPTALSATKQYAPHIVTVRIKRGEGRYENEPSSGGIDYEVKGLGEVEDLISRL
ncbi:MAG: HAD hydrolase-like protein [Candidatus Spechtbacteria bacterium]|nr:HAD hydrolase-like protein [Candidatus Spechtbacteria bacterium]